MTRDDDAISRQATIDALKNLEDLQGRNVFTKNGLYPWNVIAQLPSVISSRPTGRWIEHEDAMGDTYYDCSCCGESWSTIDGNPWTNGMKYCPNCGAAMTESEGGRYDKK